MKVKIPYTEVQFHQSMLNTLGMYNLWIDSTTIIIDNARKEERACQRETLAAFKGIPGTIQTHKIVSAWEISNITVEQQLQLIPTSTEKGNSGSRKRSKPSDPKKKSK